MLNCCTSVWNFNRRHRFRHSWFRSSCYLIIKNSWTFVIAVIFMKVPYGTTHSSIWGSIITTIDQFQTLVHSQLTFYSLPVLSTVCARKSVVAENVEDFLMFIDDALKMCHAILHRLHTYSIRTVYPKRCQYGIRTGQKNLYAWNSHVCVCYSATSKQKCRDLRPIYAMNQDHPRTVKGILKMSTLTLCHRQRTTVCAKAIQSTGTLLLHATKRRKDGGMPPRVGSHSKARPQMLLQCALK